MNNNPITLTPLAVQCRDTLALSFRANMLAADERMLHAVSAVGPAQAVRAMAAALRARAKSNGNPIHFGAPLLWQGHRLAAGGYRVRHTRLGLDTWQLYAVTDDPRFILHLTEDTLWNLLHGEQYTTPMLRGWVPYIGRTMIEWKLLSRVEHRLDCKPWYCTATTPDLDQIVSAGVRNGKLTLENA